MTRTSDVYVCVYTCICDNVNTYVYSTDKHTYLYMYIQAYIYAYVSVSAFLKGSRRMLPCFAALVRPGKLWSGPCVQGVL